MVSSSYFNTTTPLWVHTNQPCFLGFTNAAPVVVQAIMVIKEKYFRGLQLQLYITQLLTFTLFMDTFT